MLPTLDLGGAERQALVLAEFLRGCCGCEVAITALFGGTGAQAVRGICREKRIPCLRLSMPDFRGGEPENFTRAALRQFIREMRFLKPDVLLPYTALPNIFCGLGWQQAGAVASIWGQRDAGIGGEAARWLTLALERTTGFVTNSEAGFAYLAQTCHIRGERILRIANGVRLPPAKRSREAWRQELRAHPHDRIAGMIANIQPLKDHRTLLLAWKKIVSAARQPPILCLAGELTPAAAPLRKLAQDLNLGGNVRWLGRVEDVSGLLGAMDLAVFSSAKEGLPNGILEPMAAGLPVVATDNAGSRQALGCQQHAYLASPGDPDDFAKRVMILLDDPELCSSLGKANRQRVAERYSVELMGGAYERLLERILAGSRRVPPPVGPRRLHGLPAREKSVFLTAPVGR